MASDKLAIEINDETAIRRLAEDIAVQLRVGDVIALSGELGAGKSTFARALIRAVADDAQLEVPSPTFTLVQSYALRVPVTHFDLYRLSDVDEMVELGVEEAVETGAVLVEWPEKAGDVLPAGAMWMRISEGDSVDARRVEIEGPAEIVGRVKRSLGIRRFLETSGYGMAERRHLLGDASSRAYETIRTGVGDELPPILMNAPAQPDGPPIRDGKPYPRLAHLAENIVPFVAIADWLRANGFSAPEIFEMDLDQGVLVMENLGADGLLSPEGAPLEERYRVALDALTLLHRKEVPRVLPVAAEIKHHIPDYDRPAMMIEVELLIEWYLEHQRGAGPTAEEREAFASLWNEAIDGLADSEKSLVLRDYHSPNLIWRKERSGLDRLGLLDFQDAMIGPAAYDVASLVQDARVTVDEEMGARLLQDYVDQRRADAGFDEAAFRKAFAIMAAQRASKILGIFVRLNKRDRKPAYLKHLPRIQHYLVVALRHEVLSGLRRWYQTTGLLTG